MSFHAIVGIIISFLSILYGVSGSHPTTQNPFDQVRVSTSTITSITPNVSTSTGISAEISNRHATTTARIRRVIDGDTVVLDSGEHLRYIGMNASEMHVSSHGSPDCYAAEALKENKRLVEGKDVQLVRDVSDKDKYGRLLRYVYVNGTFVNDSLVKEGFAKAVAYKPDIALEPIMTASQKEAEAAQRGLWSACVH